MLFNLPASDATERFLSALRRKAHTKVSVQVEAWTSGAKERQRLGKAIASRESGATEEERRQNRCETVLGDSTTDLGKSGKRRDALSHGTRAGFRLITILFCCNYGRWFVVWWFEQLFRFYIL